MEFRAPRIDRRATRRYAPRGLLSAARSSKSHKALALFSNPYIVYIRLCLTTYPSHYVAELWRYLIQYEIKENSGLLLWKTKGRTLFHYMMKMWATPSVTSSHYVGRKLSRQVTRSFVSSNYNVTSQSIWKEYHKSINMEYPISRSYHPYPHELISSFLPPFLPSIGKKRTLLKLWKLNFQRISTKK